MSSLIWRERDQKRLEKILAACILMPVALFVLFGLYYFLAPWEVAYREQGVVAVRAQLDDLPTLSADHQVDFSSASTSLVFASAQYFSQETCETVLGHYRQVAPDHGWTFEWSDPSGNSALDHYRGVFGDYAMQLTVGCDTTNQYYSVEAHVPFPTDVVLFNWIFGSPQADLMPSPAP